MWGCKDGIRIALRISLAAACGAKGGCEDGAEFAGFLKQPIQLWAVGDLALENDNQPVHGFVGFVDDEREAREELGART